MLLHAIRPASLRRCFAASAFIRFHYAASFDAAVSLSFDDIFIRHTPPLPLRCRFRWLFAALRRFFFVFFHAPLATIDAG